MAGEHEKWREVPLVELGSPRGKPRLSLRWLVKRALLWGAAALLALGGIIAGAFWFFSRDLPDINMLRSYEPSQATRVYAGDRQLAGQFFVEKRIFVPLNRIPPELIQAVIAVEDARFYEHKGFDLFRILAATIRNVESFKIRQGASTITQQLTRSLFLTPERTFKRKIKEILLARRIEQLLSKDEILELYLNQIYFGHGAYGVQIASKTYFGKDVWDLSLAEGAFLAGLPKAPNDYSPYLHPDRARQREGMVLKRMVEEGFITEERSRKALAENLLFAKPSFEEEIAPYFLEYIRQHLVSLYGDDAVYKGGMTIRTTLDLEIQKTAVKVVREGLREIDKRQGYRGPIGRRGGKVASQMKNEKGEMRGILRVGDLLEGEVLQITGGSAVVAVGDVVGRILLEDMEWARRRLRGPDLREDLHVIEKPKAGDIVRPGDIIRVGVKRLTPDGKGNLFTLEQEPLVEGAFIALDPKSGAILAMVGGYDFKRSEFNRALSSRRQPGSAFKPIIYAAAIEKGLTPATIVVDSPVVYHDSVLDKVWKPVNYEEKFFGPITLRDALAFSRNVATVKLLEKVGVKSVIEFARRTGVKSPLTADLSLGLGSSGVSLLELASVYAVFADQGVRTEPYAIVSVTDSSGALLESHELQAEEVVSKETAYVITNMMEDVILRGTARRAKTLGRPLAGKTGTTNDFTDAWFIGYTPSIVAGVWAGFDDTRSLGDREAGASAALPIWMAFMQETLPRLPVEPFGIPDNIVYVKIDPETGLLAPQGSERAAVEIFVKGTEPTRFSESTPQPVQFFNIDEAAN